MLLVRLYDNIKGKTNFFSSDYPGLHNVPEYNLGDLQSLADVMHTSFGDYRADERQMEDNITAAMGRMEIVQQQYSIVETQQRMYFEMEMMMLEEIWADSDNKFEFDFSHRQGMEDAIQDAMDGMIAEIFAMRENELEIMLKSAEASVSHYEDAVNTVKKSINIYTSKTKSSMESMG